MTTISLLEALDPNCHMYCHPRVQRLPVGMSAEEVKHAHKSPPAGYPTDKDDYADPANYKWPVDAKHIHAAVSYYNAGSASEGGYSADEWAAIGRKIAARANELIGAGHSYADGHLVTPSTKKKKKKSGGAAKEEWAGDLLASVPELVTEEIVIGGEPCFQFEGMAIPGDAISRNTVPGKKGPTYYSAQRVRQYAAENNALLAELRAQGQRVTVYPRHAAALLDAALPTGWVDGYEVRPSSDRAGIEDVWYKATVPLSTDGRDLRTKMRTGLVQYSSLRTFEPPRFQTRPVKVNGRLVEEATQLPIAGIDLVATQPGLPVKPVRVLEEAAIVEEWVEAPAVAAVAHSPTAPGTAVAVPSEPPVVGASPPVVGATEERMKVKCPQCGAEFDVSDASAANEENTKFSAHIAEHLTAGAAVEKARADALDAELVAVRAQAAKAAAVVTTAPVAAGVSEEVAARLAAYDAQLAALQRELAGYEEAKQYMAAQKLQAAKTARIVELCAADSTMGSHMRQVLEEDTELAAAASVEAIELIYWRRRGEQANAFLAGRYQFAPGFGRIPAGLEEEHPGEGAADGTPGAAGTSTTGATRGASSARRRANPQQHSMAEMFGRVSGE